MTSRGRSAGLWAVMLIPVVLLIAALQGRFVFGRAALAQMTTLVPNPAWQTLMANVAASLALPSLAAPLHIRIPPEALAGNMLWGPVALFAGLTAWLVRLHLGRWRRIAVDYGETATDLSAFWPEPTPEPAPLCAPVVITPAFERAPPQGADLAARARFVAMSFAFPETILTRQGPPSWPLYIDCQPTRFTLTMRHAALGYRLEFRNRGAEPLGPLIIRAELVAGESRDLGTVTLPLCHYVDSLPIGESIELTGELRLPLAGITAMRLGTAQLLVPLMCVCTESAGDTRPPLSVSACFAIGLPPLVAGGGIQPFRLDTGPGIWRKLSARRQNLTDFS